MSLDQAHPLLVLACLTVLVGGAALAIAPADKRGGFLFHIVMVTTLTVLVVTLD